MLCPVDPDDRAVARGDLRPGRRRDPVPTTRPRRSRSPTTRSTGSRARSGRATARKALRVARAIETGVLSINSNTSVRVSTPFGGFKQSGYGRELGPARARRLHRGQDRLLRDGGCMGRLDGQGLRHHRRRGRHRRGDASQRVRSARARRSSASTSPTTRRGDLVARRPTSPTRTRSREHVRARARASSAASTCCSTTPASRPTDDASVLDTTLEAWQRVQDVNLQVGLPVLQARHPAPARDRRRLGDQHRLVRGGDGRRDLADLLHGVQGRRAGAVARARRRVRAPRRARQRAVPRPGRHAAAARALRQGPGAGRAAAGPRADGPLRRGATRSPTRRCSWPATSRSYVTASTFLVDGGLTGAYVTPL